MTLTDEQIFLFRHNGFLKLPEQLPEATVLRLREAIESHIRQEIAPVVRDKTGRVVRISSLWDRGEPFRAALACPQVLDPLESLLGPNIELVTNRHNHATLRLAEKGADYIHRDVLQWSRPLLTVIFYLEETTLENGCTRVIPGTHLLWARQSLRLHEDPVFQQTGVFEQTVPVPMPAGGLLALDSLVLHAAGTNYTSGTRMSMTVGYHSVDELVRDPGPTCVLVRGERLYMGNDNY